MKRVLVFLSLVSLFFCEIKPKVARITSQDQIEALIKAKNNVLVYFHLETAVIGNILIDVADQLDGKAIIAFVYCDSQDGHLLCDAMDVHPEPFILRHYYEGFFNLDYNKKITLKDIKSFLLNPLVDIPWSSQAGAENVIHIQSEEHFIETINEKKQTLFFFYLLDHKDCRKLIPIWNDLADKYEGRFQFAAIDMSNPKNAAMGRVYQIKKYPSLQYFEMGVHMFAYEDKLDANSIAEWIRKPQRMEPKSYDRDVNEHWEYQANSMLDHLSDATFADYINKNARVLVVFHAQWCGFCKKFQPVIENVARKVKAEGHKISIVAIDGSKNEKTRKKHLVDGYPKVKYFENGKLRLDIKERMEEQLMIWIRNPASSIVGTVDEWSKSTKHVDFLTEENWPQVEDRKHSFILFYAPWCGHCKNVKEMWADVAAILRKQSQFLIGAVDCTIQRTLCQKQKVGAYPSFKYYYYGDLLDTYRGGRSQSHFLEYLRGKDNPQIGHTEL